MELLPTIRSSSEIYGKIVSDNPLFNSVPIAGVCIMAILIKEYFHIF